MMRNKRYTVRRCVRIFTLYMAAVLLLGGCALPDQEAMSEEVIELRSSETPTAPTSLDPSADSGSGPDAGEVGLCPDFAQPAMLLALPDEGYALFNLSSGDICTLVLPDAIPGMALLTQGELFVASRTTGPEGQATVIRRYRPDGTFDNLPYTMTDTQAGTGLVAFTVSGDARLIAWSIVGPTAGSDLPTATLYIADMEAGQMLFGVAPEAGEEPRAFVPIRFDEAGTVLYYSWQPYGLGGIWSSYGARYHNLYAVPIDGSATSETVFDCAVYDSGLCLGDFFLVDDKVANVAYIVREPGTVVIQNGQGDVLNNLKAEQEYTGYPTWGPGGELVYYAADISDNAGAHPAPEMGFLHRVAPATAPAETLASAPALLPPFHFINETQIVLRWHSGNDSRGLALVNGDGSVQVLDVPAGAMVLDGPAVSTLLGVYGGFVSIP